MWYNHSNAFLTFWYHACRMIYLLLQNKLQLQPLLPHLSQIIFPGASFWDQQRANSRWGLDLESMVGDKKDWSPTRSIWPSFSLTYGTVLVPMKDHNWNHFNTVAFNSSSFANRLSSKIVSILDRSDSLMASDWGNWWDVRKQTN